LGAGLRPDPGKLTAIQQSLSWIFREARQGEKRREGSGRERRKRGGDKRGWEESAPNILAKFSPVSRIIWSRPMTT